MKRDTAQDRSQVALWRAPRGTTESQVWERTTSKIENRQELLVHHVGTGARIHTIQGQETITMIGVGLPVKARKEKKESQHWILSLRRFLLAYSNKR